MSTPFLISIAILSITEPSWSIIMDRVEVPEHPVVGTSVDLICHYKLENTRAGKSEDIYSVKWYKNGKEFYRYVPKDNPPSQVFNVPWITVEVSKIFHLHSPIYIELPLSLEFMQKLIAILMNIHMYKNNVSFFFLKDGSAVIIL